MTPSRNTVGRVRVMPDPIRDRLDVYVQVGDGYWLTQDGVEQAPPETVPPVFVSLPMWVADELKMVLDGRPEPATNRHLDDAVAVRDRLLTMVEAQWAKRL